MAIDELELVEADRDLVRRSGVGCGSWLALELELVEAVRDLVGRSGVSCGSWLSMGMAASICEYVGSPGLFILAGSSIVSSEGLSSVLVGCPVGVDLELRCCTIAAECVSSGNFTSTP